MTAGQTASKTVVDYFCQLPPNLKIRCFLFNLMKESGYNNKFLSAFQITTVKRAGSKKTEITDPVTRVTFEMETYFLDSKNIVKGNF